MCPGKPGNPGNVLEFFFCPGIYHFQSFVLEMSWNFFATVHQFFSHYLCQRSQHPEKVWKILYYLWSYLIIWPWIFWPLGPYLQYVNISVFATSKGEKLLLVYHKMCLISWFFDLIHSIVSVDFPQVMFSSIIVIYSCSISSEGHL